MRRPTPGLLFEPPGSFRVQGSAIPFSYPARDRRSVRGEPVVDHVVAVVVVVVVPPLVPVRLLTVRTRVVVVAAVRRELIRTRIPHRHGRVVRIIVAVASEEGPASRVHRGRARRGLAIAVAVVILRVIGSVRIRSAVSTTHTRRGVAVEIHDATLLDRRAHALTARAGVGCAGVAVRTHIRVVVAVGATRGRDARVVGAGVAVVADEVLLIRADARDAGLGAVTEVGVGADVRVVVAVGATRGRDARVVGAGVAVVADEVLLIRADARDAGLGAVTEVGVGADVRVVVVVTALAGLLVADVVRAGVVVLAVVVVVAPRLLAAQVGDVELMLARVALAVVIGAGVVIVALPLSAVVAPLDALPLLVVLLVRALAAFTIAAPVVEGAVVLVVALLGVEGAVVVAVAVEVREVLGVVGLEEPITTAIAVAPVPLAVAIPIRLIRVFEVGAVVPALALIR